MPSNATLTLSSTRLAQRHLRQGLYLSCGYLWLFGLGVLLVLAAYNSYQRATRVEEYAYSCDPFGYLNTAKEIRQAVASRQLPRFWLQTSQTELLINFMQSHNVPLPLWLDFVAPLAYHYFPRSGNVGCQYPPGAGLVLALFPEGKAVVRLNKTVIALFLVVGLAGLIWAAMRRLWIAGGFITLAAYLGLEIIGRIDGWSFSINATLPTLWLSFVCVFAGFWVAARDECRLAWLFCLLGGLFFGLAILIRLPVALLGPGFFVLLWSGSWRISGRNKFVPFAIGVLVTGILPVLLFQQYEAGAWYLPSYPPWATTPPGLQWLRSNASYYLATGPGSTDNWALAASLIGFIGIRVSRHMRFSEGLNLTWNRLLGSTVVLWVVPTAYFLTHQTIIPYYSVPGTFGAVALLAFGIFTIEWFTLRNDLRDQANAGSLDRFFLALSLLPGILVLAGGWPPSPPAITHAKQSRPRVHQFTLPAKLAEPRAWVWADFLSGTLWYYGHKPAFKIATTNTATRALVYRFVFERGDPQYLIQDSPYMKPIMDEISRMGGILEQIPGGVDGSPYFLIHWPTDGPQHTEHSP